MLADQIPRPNVYTFEQVVDVQLAAQDVSGAVATIERAIKANVPCMLVGLFVHFTLIIQQMPSNSTRPS